MQHLEGFQYTNILDLNMGYYIIRISPTIQDTMKIVAGFGKFKYNRLPMGMCDLGGIFQDKVDKLIGDIKVIKKYIYAMLVLSKESFYNHIEQLTIIFGILRTSGIKGSDPK